MLLQIFYRFFLSATFLMHPSEIASIWLCSPNNETNAGGHLSLVSPRKVIFKFRNPANGSIYARFLQLHPRSHFKNESKYWSEENSQQLDKVPVAEDDSDEDYDEVDLPTVPPDQSQFYFHYWPKIRLLLIVASEAGRAANVKLHASFSEQ